MTSNLIDLAKRKNTARRKLVEARNQRHTPAGYTKATAEDRKIATDAAVAAEQETYDNLLDEYNIMFEAFRQGVE